MTQALLPREGARPADADRFDRVRQTLHRLVDAEVLPGASLAVLRDGQTLFRCCVGWSDRERQRPLREDHIFRVFSNTKLITACAALLLVEEGRLDLDAPIARWLPMLADLPVLRPDARDLSETEAQREPIRVHHLLTHTAGFSNSHLRPGTLIGDAYSSHGILLDPNQTLEHLVEGLSGLPLMFQPGRCWEYSVCSDVLARLIEIVSGQRFDRFLQQRIFGPLGMRDTGFSVPEREQARLVAFYRGRYPQQPLRGGLERCDEVPFPGAFLRPQALTSGGGGLVSTLDDMCALMQALLSPRAGWLQPDSIQSMLRNRLSPDMAIQFPGSGAVAGRGFGYAGAVTHTRTFMDPPGSEGEVQWGGIAGTHWWLSPATGTAVVIMTQRFMSFWHLFAFQLRRDIYAALAHDRNSP